GAGRTRAREEPAASGRAELEEMRPHAQLRVGRGGGVAGVEPARRVVRAVAVVVGEQAGDEHLARREEAKLDGTEPKVVVRQAQRIGVELGRDMRAAGEAVEIVADQDEAVAVERRAAAELTTGGDG